MVSRLQRLLVAANRWPPDHPWMWSVFVGVLMFFLGWLSFRSLGIGVGAGLIWGVVFFAVTAFNMRRQRTKIS
jgi:hypothetical protein